MSAIEPQAAKEVIQLTPEQAVAVQHIGEVTFKRRLTERFSVPGARVICHRRTILGTWKPCDSPFHVYNVGMGGISFWNLGVILKPGIRIKLTLLIPKAQPISLIGVICWNKSIPRSEADGERAHSQITGVKFVDYDAGAWAVLRKIPEIVESLVQESLRSEFPRPANPAEEFLEAETFESHGFVLPVVPK